MHRRFHKRRWTLTCFLAAMVILPTAAVLQKDNDAQNKFEVRINDVVNSGKVVSVVTSNLQPTNGIMHVVDAYPEYKLK